MQTSIERAQQSSRATEPHGSASYMLAPHWLVVDTERSLAVLDMGGKKLFELEGQWRESVLAGSVSPSLLHFAGQGGALSAQFFQALSKSPLLPLTRASALRGFGYRQLFVELTKRCNEQCVHCYAESSPQCDEELSLESIRALLKDAKTLGFESVQLTGGDPLISSHFLDAVEECDRLKFEHVEIYTNGLALGDALYNQIRSYSLSFAFSFYSHDPDVHDRITRTPGSQRRTIEAIKRVLADGKRARAGVVLMQENFDHYPKVRELLEKIGIAPESVATIPLVMWVAGFRFVNPRVEKYFLLLAAFTNRAVAQAMMLHAFLGARR
ncbi:MAG: radical SAM protein [Myxococcales bacterium]|nr:MAG: radical SAM protein [Myxococcales bacterium]